MRISKYQLGKFIEISSWVITTFLLVKFVPKNRLREAHISFLFKQSITWLFGLMVVESDLISYPNRLFFPKTNKASFTFEYFVYPSLCSLFNLYYPEKRNSFIKLMYYCFHSSVITILEIIAVKYTNLIKYNKWEWYWSFTTIWITYYMSRIYHRWLFKDRSIKRKVFNHLFKVQRG